MADTTKAKRSALQVRIDAHVKAWKRFDAAVDRQEKAEERFKPLDRDTLIHSVKGKAYAVWLGKKDILERIGADFEQVRATLRSHLTMIGRSKRDVFAALADLDATEKKTFKAALAIFTAEDRRRAASPLGAAEREWRFANDAEERAWSALLAHPCKTAEAVRMKCGYLLTCPRSHGVALETEDARTLLISFAGGVDV